MRTLCHISDLHSGPPFRPTVARGVLELVAERRPDLVVISGDLTQRAKRRQFEEIRRFADELATPALAVPGNHDVPLYRVWERFLDPYGAYRRGFCADLEPVYRCDGMLVAGVNTAHGWTFTNGRFTERRLRELERLFSDAGPGDCRIVVAHHHLTPPPRFERPLMPRNARSAMRQFAELGVEMVLAGHHHQSYIRRSQDFYPTAGRPILIVHSGTSTSSRGRGGERGRNTCNWISIEHQALTVCHLDWSEEMRRFAEISRHRYARRTGFRHDSHAPA